MFVHVPGRARPQLIWSTPLLVLLSVLAFIWLEGLQPEQRTAFLRAWGAVPEQLLPSVFEGWRWLRRLGTLFTALFIHADWLHLIGNLLFLLIFGLPAERALGGRRFTVLFLVAGALANVAAVFALDAPRSVVVGCSGAVSALVGAYLALFPTARLGFVVPLGVFLEFVRTPAPVMIGVWALLQVAFSVIGPGFGAVAWSAHAAGFALGLIYGLVARPAISRRLRRG